jgi:hypothetical protein
MSSAPVLMTAHRAADCPTPTGAVPYQMSFIRYHNQFTELHRQQHFSPNAHLLFNVLLGFFNDRRTDSQLLQVETFADPFLCMATGIKSPNTLKAARLELEQRGLLLFDGGRHGRGAMGKYKLLRYREPVPGEAPLKLSKIDSLIDSFTELETGKLADKLSDKLSNFDTNYQRGRDTDLTEGGPAREAILPAAENPAAAAHTGGGGPTDVPTSKARGFSEGLRPLAEGETVPGGYVDASLPDTDAAKWVARPKDAAMVDEWLRTNTDPAKREKVGLGHLFFDYYEQFDWCTKSGSPIRNWQATARKFSFIDYAATREKEAQQRAQKVAAAGGGQLQQRSSGVESAKAMFAALGQKGGTSE